MQNDIQKEEGREDQEVLMDTLGLEGEEAKELIGLVEGGADEDEALDLIGDTAVDPATTDPYESEEPVV
jgi:hypothetical protein